MAKSRPQYCYPYPRPALTVDVAVFTLDAGRLKTLLIRRKADPFADKWALPGGFVNEGERLFDAARRELEEETGVTAAALHEFGTFGDPGRDPRGWTVSVAYFTLLAQDRLRPRAADDAAEVGWFAAEKLPALAFDHDVIIERAVTALRQRPLAALAGSGCLPRQFTQAGLRTVLEGILGRSLERTELVTMMSREINSWRKTKRDGQAAGMIRLQRLPN